jgi:DNA repair exonuclease SbcCD ATPase subunit
MITLQTLKWNNAFSYQDETILKLDSNPLTQLVGENGSGKTSIPLILQEVLYNKNVKNIKKQDIVNRHSGRKGYRVELTFEKSGDEYTVILDRKSGIKLTLLHNGEDISSHTSANTYKTIAEILGIDDFKTFVQLIYQSSTGSLEFLTATDTNRKKFLISLLQLEKYVRIYDVFKSKAQSKLMNLNTLKGKISVIESWINEHKDFDFEYHELRESISQDLEPLTDELSEAKSQLKNIKEINSKIVDNNEYKKLLSFVPINIINKKLDPISSNELLDIREKITNLETLLKRRKKTINELHKLDNQCPTCLQVVDSSFITKLIRTNEQNIKIDMAELKESREKLFELNVLQEAHDKKNKYIREFEKLSILIDNELPIKTLDKEEVEEKVKNLQKKIRQYQELETEISKHNTEAAAHNSKIDVIKEQLASYKKQLKDLRIEESLLQDELDLLEVLKRVFSTNGLVSYKIESSVKELEKTINEYLSEFSHFQIFFKLTNDKLNIQVVDELGEETSVNNLSAGELGRVNIATVLAIRKMMSSLTSTKINFLFLDEIVGVLDTDGKEKLTEILLRENLNTFIVAHEFEHPLVPKLHIVKENNSSRIIV